MDSFASGADAWNACRKIEKALHPLYAPIPYKPTCNITQCGLNSHDIYLMNRLCRVIYDAEVLGGNYSQPMLWIGIYIAAASLFCILPMAADLFHGFRNRKLWFPSKYFTLNSATITVIAIAMKLPVDLNTAMPGRADQLTKVGSLTFMWVMMANFMPSLASMHDNELLANITGVVILVVTMAVNVIIQFKTRVIDWSILQFSMTIPMYVGTMLYFLIILTSLALTIPASKRILEFKYQVAHKKISEAIHPQSITISTVQDLSQHIRRFWVMAGTCNPQFVMVTTPLCLAAGILCVVSSILHFFLVLFSFVENYYAECSSAYQWSMVLVYMTQSVGIAVGTIAPVFRCFAALNFKLSIKWTKNHMKIFKVEEYWTQMLREWKRIHLPFRFGGRGSKAFVHYLKNLILNVCIGCQMVIVVSCKMIGFIPIGMVICVVYCIYCWRYLKAMFFGTSIASNHDDIEKNDAMKDIQNYVLQLQEEMELDTRTINRILNSMNRLIQQAAKKPPNNLLELVEKSKGFKGVVDFDSDEIQSLTSLELHNGWSLPVINLTCIALALPNISKGIVDRLFTSVSEGLLYTHLVEESLNNVDEYKNIQRATMTLWHEVEVEYKWIGITVHRNAYKGKTTSEILKFFLDKAEEIVVEINKCPKEQLPENSYDKLIVANSMYRITKTILWNYRHEEPISEEKLLDILSDRIADIVVACLTNLPRVIAMKCHENEIEKREASVQAAIRLLGRTKKIIEKLPILDHDPFAFIDEWRVHLKGSIP